MTEYSTSVPHSTQAQPLEYMTATYAKVIGFMNGKTYLKSQTGILYDAYSKKKIGVWNEVNNANKFQELTSENEEYWNKVNNAYSTLMKKKGDLKMKEIFSLYNACENTNKFGSRVDSCR